MNEPLHVIATDLVTALGAGPQRVWANMMLKTCGIRAMGRFPHGRYRSDFAAEIPAETEAALLERDGCSDGGRAYSLANSVGQKALRQAADYGIRADNNRIGLALSATKAEVSELEDAISGMGSGPFRWHSLSIMAHDLAVQLCLRGPIFAVSNACASGLIAIIQAARALKRGDADAMLVIGVDVLAHFIIEGFSCLGALSAKPCRPYDANRDGLSLGEGACALLIAPHGQNGRRSLGRILGWGVTNDATHITAPSRTGEGLKLAMKKALERSGLTARDMHYINGHGTATKYNDEMETLAIAEVFGDAVVPLSSMKGYFGHTLGAAGVVEAALSLMAIKERTIPASLGLEQLGVSRYVNIPMEHLKVDTLEHVITVKSGFGGINAALVLSG